MKVINTFSEKTVKMIVFLFQWYLCSTCRASHGRADSKVYVYIAEDINNAGIADNVEEDDKSDLRELDACD